MEVTVQINGKFAGVGFGREVTDKLVGMYVERIVEIPNKLVNIIAIPMTLEKVPPPPDIPLDEPMAEVPL